MVAGGHVDTGQPRFETAKSVDITAACSAVFEYQFAENAAIGVSPRMVFDVAPDGTGREYKEYELTVPLVVRSQVRDDISVDTVLAPGYATIPFESPYPSAKGFVLDFSLAIRRHIPPRADVVVTTRLPRLGVGLVWEL